MIVALLAWALGFAAPPPRAAEPPQSPPLVVVPDRAAGYRPLLRLGSVLADSVFEEVVRSGLPLRLRTRVELWRDGFFDSLVGNRSHSSIITYEPLEGRFAVHTQASPTEVRRFSTFQGARTAVEGAYALELRPGRTGRYYYTAVVELETLSLSDLDELERWLKGELRPAVSGDGSVPGAVGQGVKRLFIRVLRLPARRFEARSEWFRVE